MITHKYGSISCYDRTLEMECRPNINNNKNNLFVCLEEEDVSFKFLGGVGGVSIQLSLHGLRKQIRCQILVMPMRKPVNYENISNVFEKFLFSVNATLRCFAVVSLMFLHRNVWINFCFLLNDSIAILNLITFYYFYLYSSLVDFVKCDV